MCIQLKNFLNKYHIFYVNYAQWSWGKSLLGVHNSEIQFHLLMQYFCSSKKKKGKRYEKNLSNTGFGLSTIITGLCCQTFMSDLYVILYRCQPIERYNNL